MRARLRGPTISCVEANWLGPQDGPAPAAPVQLPLALTFRVLGGFGVSRGGWVVGPADWRRPAAAALVRYLLVHLDEAVPEDDLFEALWPGRAERTARSSLHVAASQARGVLDPAGPDGGRLVVSARTYRLRLGERDRVDAVEFAAAARAAETAEGAARVGALEVAAALWTGEPLPEDRYSDWALVWRHELIDRYAGVLAELLRARLEAGDARGAVLAGRRLVELDPLDEASHAALMTAYARAGRRGRALAQYTACRRALVDELGIEPDAGTTRLHARVLAGEPV